MSRMAIFGPDDTMPPSSRGGVAPIDDDERRTHRPDAHLVVLGAADRLEARCSLWWSTAPPLEGHRVGVVGHYAAEDDHAARDLLDAAAGTLAEAGCTIAIGPIDGNTWRRYRFVVERGSEPPFFLEPDNDDRWPLQWRDAGFDTFTTYTSALAEDLAIDEHWLRTVLERLSRGGVAIRRFDQQRAEAELRQIYRLSLEGFQRNVLYTPLAEDEFLEQNRRLLPLVIPELVFVAERGGEPVGFLFALPDILESRRTGGTARTLVLKTIAVARNAAGAGLGSALIARAMQAAQARGFTRAIFALMHEDNLSQRLSRRYAKTMRRYALFGRALRLGAGASVHERGPEGPWSRT
jgi:GNAT superfamily N-acetyltransferase